MLSGVTHAASVGNDDSGGVNETTHRKRLSQILRYIASMHHSATAQFSFVRPAAGPSVPFFQDEENDSRYGVLFSVEDFRPLANGLEPTKPPPFTFYAAQIAPSRKRTLTGSVKQEEPPRPCWLRLTRVKDNTPTPTHPAVKRYLQAWQNQAPGRLAIRDLLDRHVNQAPAVARLEDQQPVQSFLRRYKKYLRKRNLLSALEPMYNQLFEWLQQHQDRDELVWGLGHARIRRDGLDVNGPLLEVLVEVELARDGALLIRPRAHTGVALNRQVGDALAHGEGEVLANLYKAVAEMETYQLAPGEPSSYTPILKRMAVELSSGGVFEPSGTATGDNEKLVVTDGWCLYCRPKPTTVWARDAMVLAEQLSKSDTELPLAAWSLTHGPTALESVINGKPTSTESSNKLMEILSKMFVLATKQETPQIVRPLFPLPTSDSQFRIADLLLSQQLPAVVCEGPPGTGKTHGIANLICAYLCQGKRVLVTSKGAPALSVLRNRLPKSVRELVVDVTTSESAGMRQLQQTVERLADRISRISTEYETEKCHLIRRNIEELEKELEEIDERLLAHNDSKLQFFQHPEGRDLAGLSLSLIRDVPWLMKTIAAWDIRQVSALSRQVESLVLEPNSPVDLVTGIPSPPSDALVSLVAAKAGSTISAVRNSAKEFLTAIPLVGKMVGAPSEQEMIEVLDAIRVNEFPPDSKSDWQLVLRALEHEKAMHAFHCDTLQPFIARQGWPSGAFYMEMGGGKRRMKREIAAQLAQAFKAKEIEKRLGVAHEIDQAVEARALDHRRALVSKMIQRLAADLVDATVVRELSQHFSSEAQSALIRFAQIAGKAKFSRSSQPNRMTQRQRRHRKDYLDAFDKCVRYIPCWVLTTSQISDYLPAECLFDLVVLDEASQSDITALPGMLRGRQWLIVGDGKQVSPTESFVSEEQISSLRAALPSSPLEDSLLPGQSFFDLCAQAFPMGRVILNEHFRCAPEIIAFSNEQFYDGKLAPLRLPTSQERLAPAVLDIYLRNGVKRGKTNEVECDKIVEMIRDFVSSPAFHTHSPRTIGVISLVGDEQSRLIRGRLLDAIGPQKCTLHNILVGDPPAFQGAERDVIFLSMVCSAGSCPTQSQLMHAQRVNVALSRARDRMVLVRSITSGEIPSPADVKHSVLDFFQSRPAPAGQELDGENTETPFRSRSEPAPFAFRSQAEAILGDLLKSSGYSVRDIGVIWNKALCIEDMNSASRAAVCVECAGEPNDYWIKALEQQKSIERVGWQCLRVDGLSFISNFPGVFDSVVSFLDSAGVKPSIAVDDRQAENVVNDENVTEPLIVEGQAEPGEPEEAEMRIEDDQAEGQDSEVEMIENPPNHRRIEVVVISSDEDDNDDDRKMPALPIYPDNPQSSTLDEEEVNPSQFGTDVGLEFLRGGGTAGVENSAAADPSVFRPAVASRSAVSRNFSGTGDDAYLGDQSDVGESADMQARGSEVTGGASKRRRTYRRLDKYSRDGRWYPGREPSQRTRKLEEGHQGDWYDTDTDSDVQELEGESLPKDDEHRTPGAQLDAESNEDQTDSDEGL